MGIQKKQYEGLTNEQIEQMTLAEIEDCELKRMEYNAFKVCDELCCRIDGAPAPNGYMKAYTSQKNENLFFNNHQRLKEYINASEKERKSIPGSHYSKKVETFMDTHFEIGEKYLEYVRHSCSISGEAPCDLCAESNWVGGKCARIPKPMPDYSVDGLHYMSVLHTPIETDGKARTVDDFQPRKNAKDLMEQGKLTTEDEFEHFSKTFVCEKELVKKYVQHLQILDINKRKRADVRKIQKQQRENKQFADYDWMHLFEDRTLTPIP